MATLKPFKAFKYSPSLKEPLDKLLSPPYDVISEKERQELIRQSEHNSVRLSLVEDKNDSAAYKKMADLFKSWKETEVLQQQQSPAFYLILDEFKWKNETRTRLGFVGLLEVSPFEEKKVFPHEFTLAGPKKDRLELLTTMQAELSQIYFVYKDQSFLLESLFEKYSKETPDQEATDVMGVKRKMWKISEESDISKISKLFESTSLFIADGHHRYETAIHFSKEDGTEKSKYVQSYFTNAANPDFLILPIHRVCSLPAHLSNESFIKALQANFKIEELNSLPEKVESHSDKVEFIVSLGNSQKTLLVSRDKKSDTDAEIFALQSEIFEGIFKWDIQKVSKGLVQFEHTKEAYESAVKQTENSVGFYLPATDFNLLMKVVKEDRRMPQKSTFFYPKLASGLVIYDLTNH